jgi:hypothetical protein
LRSARALLMRFVGPTWPPPRRLASEPNAKLQFRARELQRTAPRQRRPLLRSKRRTQMCQALDAIYNQLMISIITFSSKQPASNEYPNSQLGQLAVSCRT